MIDWCYLHESPLPKDIEKIAKLIRMRTHCECIADVLQEFWIEEEEGYFNAKVNADIAHYRNKSAKSKAAADARWAKHALKNKQLPKNKKGNADAIRTHSGRNANKELIIKNKELIIPDGINIKKWEEFVNYRKAKKKTISDLAAKKLITFLSDYTKDEQKIIIDQSITSDWQGLFPPKGGSNGNQKPRESAASRTAENIKREFGQGGPS
jgi:uncharacterized protein YdaU (DUF1376 family)